MLASATDVGFVEGCEHVLIAVSWAAKVSSSRNWRNPLAPCHLVHLFGIANINIQRLSRLISDAKRCSIPPSRHRGHHLIRLLVVQATRILLHLQWVIFHVLHWHLLHLYLGPIIPPFIKALVFNNGHQLDLASAFLVLCIAEFVTEVYCSVVGALPADVRLAACSCVVIAC